MRYKNGEENYVETLESIKKTKIESDIFNVPSNYKEAKNPLFHSDF